MSEFEQNWRLVGFPTSGFWKKSELLLTWYLWDVVMEAIHKMMYRQLLVLLHGKQHLESSIIPKGNEKKNRVLWSAVSSFLNPRKCSHTLFPHVYGKAPQCRQSEWTFCNTNLPVNHIIWVKLFNHRADHRALAASANSWGLNVHQMKCINYPSLNLSLWLS